MVRGKVVERQVVRGGRDVEDLVVKMLLLQRIKLPYKSGCKKSCLKSQVVRNHDIVNDSQRASL